ncbi:PH domain-containing protein [Kribbella solani]|uniref:Membrane protein YdbS with pleckstrin-like domain n=1 Tax=Kribbella solani TaxID=236067 RepID=A0A841DVE4_9ACTN|nr:PH domain-containing protein [Kribbella solani]MBB5982592.1 membrane protein YdbS with pleckstrin-like domain [Kribbella solani]MDX2967732.1 PH domain-containing protein [Kribbella solani]MDX3001110.1 PH domain-containing protein [Kribbella solani]
MDDLFAPSDVSWMPVSPKLATLRRLNAAITGGLLAIVALVALGLTVGWLYGVLAVVVIALLFAWSWVLIGRNQRSWKYAEREDELLVSHGIMFRELVVVPYGRMQFVDVTAGPLERAYGMATVELHTATPATDAKIPGLHPDEASRLRDRLSALGQAQAWGL